MPNRQLFTLKFKTSRLKEFGYNVDVTFDEAKELNEAIALADNQILRCIRDIRKRVICSDRIERLYLERKIRQKHSYRYSPKENLNRIKEIQNKINRTLFVPDYITIVVEHESHYNYIYKNGLMVNGNMYRRLSCAAGQARNSTVVLCNTEILGELNRRLNNNRNIIELAPSKFNAYFGLSGSATFTVSEPEFIVVRDFENENTFRANFITETSWDEDDTVEKKDVTLTMNRTDGMGLISPRQAQKWADELGLDYIPSQFGIRQSFIKGMLCTFPIHDFCKEKNNGNYIIDTIYKDSNGEYIKADLRDYDVIISESQFKLWDSYSGIEGYIKSCHENNLNWGVPQYAPKQAKDILKMNYQFIQTLNLNQQDIENLCKQFVDWIQGVSYDNVPYMLLFLLGVNNDEEKINRFLKSNNNYWIKSLIVNPELKNDKYIRSKIRNLIKTKIQNGCMGDIFVDGNFQILVSDPYGFMQHVCGQEVTGLLKKNEFYSNYWNECYVTQVDGMRSPLTFRSEHVIMNLIKNNETEKWYRYCKLGIILNYHGHEVCNFGGADFDLDILATTSSKVAINGVYRDELPVVYDAPKPQKIIFTDDDLYQADLFSFGSIIGPITNKGSNAYALLSLLEETLGKDSREYQVTYSRIKQCCKAQSAQIDKAKIGKEVKGIPKIWVEYQKPKVDKETGKILSTGRELEEIQFYNSILLNKYPYFFKYRYRDCKKTYDKYVDENEVTCHQKFRMSLSKLINLKTHDGEQSEFISNYYKYMPVIISDSPMNLLCHHIEKVNFNIGEKTKTVADDGLVNLLKNKSISYTQKQYDDVVAALQNHVKNLKVHKNLRDDSNNSFKFSQDNAQECDIGNEALENKLWGVCENIYTVVNCLIDYYYVERLNSDKDVLWETFGKYIFNNIKKNTSTKITFPFPCLDGDIEYLGKKYQSKEMSI